MPGRKSLKPIPKFESEDKEREFWASHDSTDYVDWGRARVVTFSRLKPSTQTISLRLPASLLENLRMLANKRDVPYQSLLKVFLAERVDQELRRPDALRFYAPAEARHDEVREPGTSYGGESSAARKRGKATGRGKRNVRPRKGGR